MLKKIFILGFLTLTSKVQSQNPNEKPLVNLWTIEQVKEMAKKYNLQDSISMTRNNFLLFVSKEQIEKFLKTESSAIQHREQFKIFRKRTKFIRNYSDYLTLVNSLPYVREAMVEMAGGEVKYLEHQKEALKKQWRIYRTDSGSVRFIEASSPFNASELSLGQRIDNQFPQKDR